MGGVSAWSRIRESICIFLRKIKERMPSSRHPATVHRTAALEWVRLPTPPRQKKNTTRLGGVSIWSRIRESNPPSRLGKPLYYRYTNPACSIDRGHYSRPKWKFQPFFVDRNGCSGEPIRSHVYNEPGGGISCFPPDKLGLKLHFCAKFWVEFPFRICYDIVVSIWAERLERYTAKSQF